MREVRRVRTLIVAAASIVGAVNACRAKDNSAGRAATGTGGAELVTLDTLRLQESDSASLSSATGFVVSRDGHLYIGDAATSRVYVFASSGSLERTISRKGRGPGELPSTGPMTLVGDSLLVVRAATALHAFDARSGRHRWSKPGVGGFVVGNVASAGDRLYLAAPDGATGHSVISISADSVISRPVRLGPLPAVYRKNPQIVVGLAATAHAARDGRDGLHVVAIEASNHLYVWRENGAIDSIDMPVVKRRGARLDLIEAAAIDMSKGTDAVFKSSMPMDIALLSDTVAAVMHSDLDLDQKTGRFSGRFWLSMVNVASKRACTDLALDLPSDPLPRLAVQGDTIYALVQLLEGNDARAAVVRFRAPLDARC